MDGWYAMKRGWLDHEIFQPKGPWSKAEAWVWMVENACFKPTPVDIGGKPYTVPRGSLVYSQRFLATKWRWSKKAVTTFIAQLEAHGVVEKKGIKTGPSPKQRRDQITLCNYEKYQQSGTIKEPEREPQQNHKGTKEEQGNNTPVGKAAPSDPKIVDIDSVKATAWRLGKALLERYGFNDPGKGVGVWMKDAGGKASLVLMAIESAQKVETEDPFPYVRKFIQSDSQQKTKPSTPKPVWQQVNERTAREGAQ